MSATPEPLAREIVEHLRAVQRGETEHEEQLVLLIYEPVLAMARQRRRRLPPEATLQTGDLAHATFLRLFRGSGLDGLEDERALWRVIAATMQRVLLDAARRRFAKKRGGDYSRSSLELAEVMAPPVLEDVDQEALAAALERLRRFGTRGQRAHEVVRNRCFAGLTMERIAALLGVSRRTIQGDWDFARAFLARDLGPTLRDEGDPR